jgi:hypothetical protein
MQHVRVLCSRGCAHVEFLKFHERSRFERSKQYRSSFVVILVLIRLKISFAVYTLCQELLHAVDCNGDTAMHRAAAAGDIHHQRSF